MGLIRSFFALPLSEQNETLLAKCSQSLQAELSKSPLRWVPPENFHLTLAFLGNIREAELQKLEGIAVEVAARHRAEEITFSRIGWFPGPHKPRLLGVLPEPNPALVKLQADLLQSLRQRGFDVESRRFKPHITLARVGRDLPVCEIEGGEFDVSLAMDELVLFASELAPGGARYYPLFAEPIH